MTRTINEVLDASKRVVHFIQQESKAPKTVRVGSTTVTFPSFNRMMAATLLEIENNRNRSILTTNINASPNPQRTLKEGKFLKENYIDAAQRALNFMATRQQFPNYVNTPLGFMDEIAFLDIYSRILNFYGDEKYLPKYAYTTSLSNIIEHTAPVATEISAELKPYLEPTLNCQVNDPAIQALANELNTPERIFYWVRDNISYDFYYNTRHGAVGTLRNRRGNCCDQTHLQNALLRAKGYPALYRHVTGRFGSSNYGHIYTRAFINNKWIPLDPASPRNTFDTINWWTLVSVLNNYRELPF